MKKSLWFCFFTACHGLSGCVCPKYSPPLKLPLVPALPKTAQWVQSFRFIFKNKVERQIGKRYQLVTTYYKLKPVI